MRLLRDLWLLAMTDLFFEIQFEIRRIKEACHCDEPVRAKKQSECDVKRTKGDRVCTMTCEIARLVSIGLHRREPAAEQRTDEAIRWGCFELYFDLATIRWQLAFSPSGFAKDEICHAPSCDGSGIFRLKSASAAV